MLHRLGEMLADSSSVAFENSFAVTASRRVSVDSIGTGETVSTTLIPRPPNAINASCNRAMTWGSFS